MIVVRIGDQIYLLDAPFIPDLDEYRSSYRVYLLDGESEVDLTASWEGLSRHGSLVGEVPVAKVALDASRRSFIDPSFIDRLTEAT
jgi:hypothetical protein